MTGQPLDATLCPICGKPNRCAMEVEKETGAKQPPCWCTGVDFTADLLAKVPPDKQRLACICAACAAAASAATPAAPPASP